MKEQPAFVVVYDLSEDKERRRVDKVLVGFGFRVQKSVFECRLSRADLRQLTGRLKALHLRSGGVRIYRIYAGTPMVVEGRAVPVADEFPAFVY